jgi:hypothetical protein
MKSKQKLDPSAKARINRAETAKHGRIRVGSFGSEVQRVVDRNVAKWVKPAKGTRTR